tara:strand:+ start:2523 stop:3020 length:498 start_codon:yes stop_codon:yes gene_type:complete
LDEVKPHTIEKRVIAHLKNLSVNYEWLPVDPDYADTALFCKKYNFSLSQSGNTIIIASKRNPKSYSACLVLATDKLDVNKKVKSLMEVSKLSFATQEETINLTGMLIGGVTVFGLPKDIPIYVDSKVIKEEKIVLGGGSREGKIIVPAHEIEKIQNVRIIENLSK